MGKEIVIDYNRPTDNLFKHLISLMKNQKGFINGDKENGIFEVDSPIGLFKGNYNVKDGKIIFILSSKPFFISHKLIESEVIKYLKEK